MAGEAKTNKFMIGEATIMVGPMASAFDLMPAAHSLGLAKNLQIQVETGNAELTQGVENTPIFSVQNQFNPTGSCEVYEYTARNLAYGMGLDASGTAYDEVANSGPFALNAAVNAAATSIILTAGQGANFAVGDTVVMQQNEDQIYVGVVTVKATDTLTVNRPTPAGVTWATATTRVFKTRAISATGGQTNFLSLKAVVVAAGGRPIPIIFPKIRITRGFNVSIGGNDFGNLPFEFKPYPLVSTDALFNSFQPGEVFRMIVD